MDSALDPLFGHIAGCRPLLHQGEVTEWPKVQHWKCCVCQKCTGGSNPPLSANLEVWSNRIRPGVCPGHRSVQSEDGVHHAARGCAQKALDPGGSESGRARLLFFRFRMSEHREAGCDSAVTLRAMVGHAGHALAFGSGVEGAQPAEQRESSPVASRGFRWSQKRAVLCACVVAGVTVATCMYVHPFYSSDSSSSHSSSGAAGGA